LLEELARAQRVVGVKQSRKALLEGRAAQVFLARDADPALTGPLADECARQAVPVVRDFSMEQLGRACRITVGASVAVVLRA